MMRSIRTLAVVFTTALALSAVSVASASAHEFFASKEGTTKDKGLTVQKFKTNGGTVECKKEESEGKVSAGSSKTTVEKVKYSECKGPFGAGATVSESEDEFSAEGWVSILKKQTVKVLTCETVVEPSTNKELKTIGYANNSGKLKVNVNVSGITYISKGGGLCGSSGSNGTYTGESEEELPNGTLEWK